MSIALNRHSTNRERLRTQVVATLEGTGAFVRFVDALIDAYFDGRGLDV